MRWKRVVQLLSVTTTIVAVSATRQDAYAWRFNDCPTLDEYSCSPSEWACDNPSAACGQAMALACDVPEGTCDPQAPNYNGDLCDWSSWCFGHCGASGSCTGDGDCDANTLYCDVVVYP